MISRQGSQLITFIIYVILARLLSPREFGLIAMVMVFGRFAYIFAEMGFAGALIQKQDLEQEQSSSVFWLNIMVGLLLMLGFMSAAPVIATFYREPLLLKLTMFVSVAYFVYSFGIVQRALMKRHLIFEQSRS